MSQIAKRRSAAASAEADSTYGQKREEILQAAARVFLRLGFWATKLSDVASEAGMDRASLYYYYGSKDDLFHDLSSRAVIGNIDATKELAESTSLSASDKLARAIEILMVSFEASYPYMYVLVREDVSRWRAEDREQSPWVETVHQWSATYFNLLRRIINEGIETDEFTSPLPSGVLAHCVIGMLNYSYTWFQPGGVLNAAEIAAGMSKVVLAGLSPERGRQRHR
jgi:AcrR family transcriptional regulator